MNFADQSQRERKTITQSAQTVIERGHIARNFLDIIERHAGRFVIFEEQQISKRRLCAFDLRRQNGFFSNVKVNEERSVRSSIASPSRRPSAIGLLHQVVIILSQLKWRVRRQRGWDKCLILLTCSRTCYVLACSGAFVHLCSLAQSCEKNPG